MIWPAKLGQKARNAWTKTSYDLACQTWTEMLGLKQVLVCNLVTTQNFKIKQLTEKKIITFIGLTLLTKKNHYGLSQLRSAPVQYEVKNENISQHLTKNTTRKLVLLERKKNPFLCSKNRNNRTW